MACELLSSVRPRTQVRLKTQGDFLKHFNAKNTAVAICVAFGTALISAPAYAGSQTSNLSVTATVTANCSITTTPVAFGSYDPVVANAATALAGTGTVVIACTTASIPTIGLGLGLNASGAIRRMISGAQLLPYELYQATSNVAGAACAASPSTVWGTSGVNLLTTVAAPSKAARTYNVCGSIPGGADVAAGAYADTVVATVNF